MTEVVDAGQHLPLINRVIGQIGLRGDIAEEAYSEGLVAITEAAQTYDPAKGPLAHWLANNIKWRILDWRNREIGFRGVPIMNNHGPEGERGYTGFHTSGKGALTSPEIEIGTAFLDVEDEINHTELSHELREVLRLIELVCNAREKQVILLTAVGYKGSEICKLIGMTPVQVTRAKQSARMKLEKARG